MTTKRRHGLALAAILSLAAVVGVVSVLSVNNPLEASVAPTGGDGQPMPGVKAATPTAALFAALSLTQPEPEPKVPKFALLVGCSKYQSESIPSLNGPANDVPLVATLLTGPGFDFPEKNLTKLVGWPDDPKARPTRQNIVAAFKDLIQKAQKDSQVVILMSGHGGQVPVLDSETDKFDPKSPAFEADGLDEVFLPADAGAWDPDKGATNMIVDDEFGEWLDQFKGKGAHVWIIFDCCHSGGMDRDVSPAAVEIPRQVDPKALKVPSAAIEKAQARAVAALAAAKGAAAKGAMPAPNNPDVLNLKSKDKNGPGQGSLVAFYGAQAFEEALEMPRPQGAGMEPVNYHGLLTYTLIQALKQHQDRKLTYNELAQDLTNRILGERGVKPPTPYCEGDLDREVLGLAKWPKRSALVLQRKEGKLKLNAGELAGITEKSILAVYPPVTDPKGGKQPLGHVQVVDIAVAEAVVEPCPGPKGEKKVQAKDLPDQARCEMVVRDMGEMRLKIALQAADTKKDGPAAAKVEQTLKLLDKDIQPLFVVTPKVAEADWILWVRGGKVTWRPGQGAKFKKDQPDKQKTTAKTFGAYATADQKELAKVLERDVQALFTWANLWRIAGAAAGQPALNPYEVKLEVIKLKADGKEDGPLVNGEPLLPEQKLKFRVVNDSYHNLWLTVLEADASFAIDIPWPQVNVVADKSKTQFVDFHLTSETLGKEGLIVLAFSQAEVNPKPDLSVLLQKGLEAKEWDKSRDVVAGKTPNSPFGKLLNAAAAGSGARQYLVNAPSNPSIVSTSWVMMPGKK